MNQPEAHQILQALRAIVDIVAPGVLLKAEAIVPTKELPAYLGSADARECHIAYHSSLMAAGWLALSEQSTSVMREVIRNTPDLPPAATWLSYVRCHDDIGWNVLRAEAAVGGQDANARLARASRFFAGAEGSYAVGATFQSTDPNAAHGTNGMAASLVGLQSATTEEERELAMRRMLLLHGLALSFGALPVLYMGDELAMENDYSYLHRPQHAMDSRWLQRPVFDEPRWAQRNAAIDAAAAGASRMYQSLLRMVRARRQHEALAANAPRTLLADAPDGVLALARGERFVTLINFSGQPQSFALQGQWTDCLDGGILDGAVTLEPYAMHWLERGATA
jgi:amylosucrase